MHPGLIVAETLERLRVNAFTASKALGVQPSAVTRVINGQVNITPDMALRIGRYFGNGPFIWLRLQQDYDLYHRSIALKDKLAKIPKLTEVGGKWIPRIASQSEDE